MASSSKTKRAAEEGLPDDCEPNSSLIIAGGGRTSDLEHDNVRQFLTDLSPDLGDEFDNCVKTALRMPEDGVVPTRTCNCSPPGFITLTTIWDDSVNRGRRVFTCAKRNGNDCGYTYFLHDPIPMCAATVVDFLYNRVRLLTAANIILRHKVAVPEEAKKKLAGGVTNRWTHDEIDDLLSEMRVTPADIANKWQY